MFVKSLKIEGAKAKERTRNCEHCLIKSDLLFIQFSMSHLDLRILDYSHCKGFAIPAHILNAKSQFDLGMVLQFFQRI